MVRNGKICLLAAVMALLLLLTACGHEHTWVEETTEDYIQAVTVKTRTCEECGEMEEERIPMETLHSNSKFLCTSDEFILRMHELLQEGSEKFGTIAITAYSDVWMLESDDLVLGCLSFTAVNKNTNAQFSKVSMTLGGGTQEENEFLFTVFLRACIPALDDPDALLDRVVKSSGDDVTEDDLTCKYEQYDGVEWITVSVPNPGRGKFYY